MIGFCDFTTRSLYSGHSLAIDLLSLSFVIFIISFCFSFFLSFSSYLFVLSLLLIFSTAGVGILLQTRRMLVILRLSYLGGKGGDLVAYLIYFFLRRRLKHHWCLALVTARGMLGCGRTLMGNEPAKQV